MARVHLRQDSWHTQIAHRPGSVLPVPVRYIQQECPFAPVPEGFKHRKIFHSDVGKKKTPQTRIPYFSFGNPLAHCIPIFSQQWSKCYTQTIHFDWQISNNIGRRDCLIVFSFVVKDIKHSRYYVWMGSSSNTSFQMKHGWMQLNVQRPALISHKMIPVILEETY